MNTCNRILFTLGVAVSAVAIINYTCKKKCCNSNNQKCCEPPCAPPPKCQDETKIYFCNRKFR